MSIKKLGKKGMAILLSFAMLMCFVPGMISPTIVKAEGTALVKNLNMGVIGIDDPDSTGLENTSIEKRATSEWSNGEGSYVYFGDYYQTNATNKEPIKWRILDKDGMLLMSDKILEVMRFNPSGSANDWATSNIKKWLNSESGIDLGIDLCPPAGFFDLAFTVSEKAVIKATNKGEGISVWDGPPATRFAELNAPSINGEKIFLLSAEEANSASYGFANEEYRSSWDENTTRRIIPTDYAKAIRDAYVDYVNNTYGMWWLRSAARNMYSSQGQAGNVESIGALAQNDINSNTGIGVVPALNLDSDLIVFTSASGESKANSFKATNSGAGNKEWNLTIKGTDADLGATLGGSESSIMLAEGYSAKNITINHSAASAILDEATQVSALLVDENGTVLYYGKINNGEATSSTFEVPAGIAEGDYELFVVAEKVTAGNAVDYVSNLGTSISFAVKPASFFDSITGNDFTYEIGDGNLAADAAKVLADVEALHGDGTPIALAEIIADSAELQAITDAIGAGTAGSYPLTFTTAGPGGATKVITVTLTNGTSSEPKPGLEEGNGFLTKRLVLPKGAVVKARDFEFLFSKVSVDSRTGDTDKATMPDLSAKQSFAGGEATTSIAADGLEYAEGTTNYFTAVDAAGAPVTWPHAGEYVYRVTEKPNPDSDGAYTYSLAEYEVTVYVTNTLDGDGVPTGAVQVNSVGFRAIKDDAGTSVAADDDDKQPKTDPVFTNKYEPLTTFEVSKIIKGSYADTTYSFSYTLEMSRPKGTETTAKTYTGIILNANGTVDTSVAPVNVVFGAGNMAAASTEFKLKHGQYLRFEETEAGDALHGTGITGLPTGITYKLTEEAAPGYTATANVIINGETGVTKSNATQNTALIIGGGTAPLENSIVLGENDNEANWINTYKEVTPTGILLDSLPFMLLIILAVGGFVGYIASKRRRAMSY